MKNKIFYFLILCNYCFLNAQVYKTDGSYYSVKDNQVTIINYKPGQPKGGGISTSASSLAVLITSDYTETNYDNSTPSALKLHVFAPEVNTGQRASSQALQVIVFGVGCGFSSYWVEGISDVIPKWLAKQGYIVVCPEYRIGIDLYNSNLAPRAIWRAVQDVRQTIKYAKNSLNSYANNNYYALINTPLVYVGYSSGAFIGIHNLYFNNDNKPSYIGATSLPAVKSNFRAEPSVRSTIDLGTLDNPTGYGTLAPNSTETSGTTDDPAVQDITIAVSGAIGSTNYIANSTNSKPKALLMIHDPNDGVVPYSDGFAFKNFGIFYDFNYDYPPVSGSYSIDNYFALTNSSKKPSIYNFLHMDINCISNDCIIGNSQGKYFILGGIPTPFYTWYHDPTEAATKYGTMTAILSFIRNATTSIMNGTYQKNAVKEDQPIGKIFEEIILSPNPVSGDILNITGIETNAPYRILNILDQEVSGGKVENEAISLTKLSAGTYTIELINKDQRIVKRFIKQ